MRWKGLILFMIAMQVSVMGMDKKEGELIFIEANEKFEEENYKEAILLYESLTAEYDSAELFHNLALCYFYINELAKGMLNMERAVKLKPGNKNIRRDLRLLKENVDSEITSMPEFFIKSWFKSIANQLGITTWLILHLLALLAMVVCLYLYLIKKMDFGLHFYYMQGFIIGFLLLSVLFASFAYNRNLRINADHWAIVMEDNVTLRLSADDNAPETAKVNEGVKVKIEDEINEYYKIKLEDFSEAWIAKGNIERI